eukprot:scaffold113690_cov21-Tisochrysis_lutea.AAC.1
MKFKYAAAHKLGAQRSAALRPNAQGSDAHRPGAQMSDAHLPGAQRSDDDTDPVHDGLMHTDPMHKGPMTQTWFTETCNLPPLPRSDLLRENKRNLDKAIRDLDRERMGLQNQEKRIIQDIKKMAKEGQM